MTGQEWVVLAVGVLLITWINWYFLAAHQTVQVAQTAGGTQEITIVVRGGYEPAAIRVARDRPVRLIFDRQEASGCSEEIVFPDLSLRRFLPAHQQTSIDLPARPPGAYEFTCGMGMLHGRVIVE
jgi:plastocyanin domain-containing protein